MRNCKPEDIDAILPQTQCGLCGYGGCIPYAEGLIYENASIDLCTPGGVDTLKAISNLLDKDPAPFIDSMRNKHKTPSVVTIRESECIGCTKCIKVCPVDAIIGAGKLMHTVITDECTGCDLCIPACPVDCIDVIPITHEVDKAPQFRERFNARSVRIEAERKLKESAKQQATNQEKKSYINDALKRVQLKKSR